MAITDNQDRYTADPCGHGPLHLHWVISGVNAGTPVVIDLTVPGLPAKQTLYTAADGSINEDLPIGGNGIRTTHIESIGGQPAPAANDDNSSSVTGCPP